MRGVQRGQRRMCPRRPVQRQQRVQLGETPSARQHARQTESPSWVTRGPGSPFLETRGPGSPFLETRGLSSRFLETRGPLTFLRDESLREMRGVYSGQRRESPRRPVQRQQRVHLGETPAARQHARQTPERLRFAAAARADHQQSSWRQWRPQFCQHGRKLKTLRSIYNFKMVWGEIGMNYQSNKLSGALSGKKQP